MTGAEALAAGLRDAGVEVCFGLPGVHNLPLWQVMGTPADGARIVGVRHEQAAAYAADGYARAGGRVGVALVTTGPGAANTLGALGEAWASRSPVVVVATDVPSSLRGPEGVVRMSLHEGADQAGMARPVTKAVFEAGAASELRALARMACEVAAAPPARPVWLQVPADLLRADAGDAPPLAPADLAPPALPAAPGEPASPALPASCALADTDLRAAAAALAAAERPLVWAGGGALADGAGAQVLALARRLGAPVLTTFSARGLVGDDELAVGLPPHLPEAGALWDAADVVVAVGSDLDGMSTQNWRQPQPPVLVAVNVDPEDATKSYEVAHALAARATDGVAALLAELGDGERAAWVDLEALRGGAWARLRAEFPEELTFLDAVRAAVPPQAVVLADMCIPGYWLAGFHRVPAPRRLQYPMGWGTLGYAFPASLGAACAASPAVSFSGDGGFLFACGELATAAQERLPLTAVVVDDGGYGMLRYDQRRAGGRRDGYGVDLRTPDFAALAQAFDIHAESVDGVGAAFADALARHLADDEPSLLAVRARLQPPPTTSPRWYRTAGGL